MSNHPRGEHGIELGGRRFVLRLTLGALAEIEAAFAVEGLEALGRRLSGPSLGAADIIRLIGALIRGGEAGVSDAELAGCIDARDLPAIIAAIGDLFAASFPGGEGGPANPR